MSTFKWQKENLQGKGFGLPDTFKCRICNKIKRSTNDHYSKKEMKTYTSRIAMGKMVTGFSANLRCRHCSGENVFELLCQNCHITKSKDDFSYNQRTAAISARCKACVNWQETNEPGTETLPGPSMALHPDNTLTTRSNSVDPNPGNAFPVLVASTNQAADDDDQSSVWRTTQPSNNTMSVPTGTSVRPTTTKASVVETALPSAAGGFMVPTRRKSLREVLRIESAASNPYGSRPSSPVSAATDVFAQFNPFGNGGKAVKANAGGSVVVATASADSETVTEAAAGDTWTTPTKKATEAAMGYDAPGSSTTTPAPRNADGWTAVPAKNKKAGATFTGYDNQGTPHLQTVAPSTAASSTRGTTTSSVTAATAYKENVASGGYGKPGHTTPRGGTREWFKPGKPDKGDTTNYGFEAYVVADLDEHVPRKGPRNDGWESEDEM
ncbi:hypothetical protein V500_02804 [Pseudogymnoascus sp. VKM F-4518 (FW-2643)]|nr:hypothetical protein V500_02804 [Pseudogymnoascus sp. VKM F-4518 (FW-2643)]